MIYFESIFTVWYFMYSTHSFSWKYEDGVIFREKLNKTRETHRLCTSEILANDGKKDGCHATSCCTLHLGIRYNVTGQTWRRRRRKKNPQQNSKRWKTGRASKTEFNKLFSSPNERQLYPLGDKTRNWDFRFNFFLKRNSFVSIENEKQIHWVCEHANVVV